MTTTDRERAREIAERVARGHYRLHESWSIESESEVGGLVGAITDALLSFAPSSPVSGEGKSVSQMIAEILRDVSEWDDRTSPAEYPDHLLITGQELEDLLSDFAARLRSGSLAQEGWRPIETAPRDAWIVARHISTGHFIQVRGWQGDEQNNEEWQSHSRLYYTSAFDLWTAAPTPPTDGEES